MQMYGPTLLTTNVATKDDLDQLVMCVAQLPDPEEVVEGTVMILTRPQPGYTATHYYRCETVHSYLMDYKRWVDVGKYGPEDPFDSSGAHVPKIAYDWDMRLKGIWYTGYMSVWWNPIEDHETAGPLVYETLVRKIGNWPQSPTDGEIIVRAPKGVVYTEDKPYHFDDLLTDNMGDKNLKIYYELFHVFKSGWCMNTHGPIHEWNPKH